MVWVWSFAGVGSIVDGSRMADSGFGSAGSGSGSLGDHQTEPREDEGTFSQRAHLYLAR